MNSTQDTKKVIDEMKEKIEVIEKSCEGDEDHICDANNELIDEIVKLYDTVMEEKIASNREKTNEIRSEYEENKKMRLGNVEPKRFKYKKLME